jgi:hypothetical protein
MSTEHNGPILVTGPQASSAGGPGGRVGGGGHLFPVWREHREVSLI